MKNRVLIMAVKAVSFLLLFILVFAGIQKIFISVIGNDEVVDEFYSEDIDSIEAMFFGPSQMFNTVNTPMLMEKYGISAYAFGAAGQRLNMSGYYVREALKRQTPKVVAVEVSKFFDDSISPEVIAWSYASMPFTKEKYLSLKSVFDGDIRETVKHLLPLISYHSTWKQINPLSEIVGMFKTKNGSSRGFSTHYITTPLKMAYVGSNKGPAAELEEKIIEAVYEISILCEKRNVKLMFFKSPSSTWTGSQSETVKTFMRENKLTYLEMNDYLEVIGIDAEKDFFDEEHLNYSGADKSTEFMAKYLMENYDL